MSSKSLDATIATLNLSFERLELVKQQLSVLKETHPANRQLAITNTLSLARSVYHSLAQIRKCGNDQSKAWFKIQDDKLASSETNNWLRKARDVSLKEAKNITKTGAHITSFNGSMMNKLVRPAGAKGFFIGDQNGGSGWDIIHSDGSQSVLYVNLEEAIPEAGIKTWCTSQFAPAGNEHVPIEQLFEQYITEYGEILQEGLERFSDSIGR